MNIHFVDLIPSIQVSLPEQDEFFVIEYLHGNKLNPQILAFQRLVRREGARFLVGQGEYPDGVCEAMLFSLL